MRKSTHFIMMNNENHPIGRCILSKLLLHGYVPKLLIEEQSVYAQKKTLAYESRIPCEMLPTSRALAKRHNVPIHYVSNINDLKCLRWLEKHQPDLLILGNNRIVKSHILEVPTVGCINTHPGLLPDIRGSFPQCWSIVHDVPLGCSCHFIDLGIDTGPLISSQSIPIFPGETLATIVERTMYVSAELMLKALECYQKGILRAVPQAHSDTIAFTWPPDDIIAEAINKLETLSYKHFSDPMDKESKLTANAPVDFLSRK